MKRRAVTEELSRAVERRCAGAHQLWASEVEVGNRLRVDFMGFNSRGGGWGASCLELGSFVCYEVKSCMADFESGHGLNLVGDLNWIVCGRGLCEELRTRFMLPPGAGVLCPDSAGRLRAVVEPAPCWRRRPAIELLWAMVKLSYALHGSRAILERVDLMEPRCDRDALAELVGDMEDDAAICPHPADVAEHIRLYARRIREACGTKEES